MPRALCRSEVLAKERIEKEGEGKRGSGDAVLQPPLTLVCQDDVGAARTGWLWEGGKEEQVQGRLLGCAASSRGRVGEEGKGREGGELGERKKMQRRVSKGVTNEVRSGRDTRESTFKLTKLLGHQFTLIYDKFRHHHFFVTMLSEGARDTSSSHFRTAPSRFGAAVQRCRN